MSGKFPFMIFGLPAAALAIYNTAYPERRKTAGGLLLSAALTSMLTGITEPLEFTFLFTAPLLYGIHCVLSGLSYMLMHIFGVGVGMTFSGGLIDLTLFGVLQGNSRTNWIWIPIVGAAYAVVYYFVFRALIKRFDYKTPGRELLGAETRLYNRNDYNERKQGDGKNGGRSEIILSGLGGRDNISDIDCCATRLRVTVKDPNAVDESVLKKSKASGVIKKGNGVQIIFGPEVSVIKSELEDYLEGISGRNVETDSAENGSNPPEAEELCAHMSGEAVPLENTGDEAFSGKILGDGIAVEPSEGRLYAPCDGTVVSVADTLHAVNIVSNNGCELLLHIGIDTVKLNGRGFNAHVKNGDTVKKGELLISFELELLKAEGYNTVTPMIICNTDDYTATETLQRGHVEKGDKLIRLV